MTRNGNKKIILLTLLLLFCFVSFGCGIPAGQRYIYLNLNTAPQGAKIYEGGKYKDRTPEILDYILYEDQQDKSVLITREIVFVLDGYLPVKKKYRLELDSQDKQHFYDLILLEPRYRHIQRNDQNITIKQEESTSDKLLKAGQIGLILQSLKPIR